MPPRDDKVDAWMPMFPRDFLSATEGLSAVDGWAYTRLLLHSWLEHGYLPYDPAELARLAKVTPLEWLATWGRLAKFFTVADGRISQGRLLYELEEARANRKKAKDAGRAGAEARWAAKRDAEQDAVALRSQCPSPSPSPSPAEEIPPTPRRRGAGPESEDFVRWWTAYPRKAARDRAWRAWQRTAGGRPPLSDMLATLEWQRRLDFDRRPPDRVPYPAKYLYDGQYRDEPPQENGASSARPPPKDRICPFHRQTPDQQKSEVDPTCPTCRRLGARPRRRGSGEATPASEIVGKAWPPKEKEVQR